jgi:hypothetical protein
VWPVLRAIRHCVLSELLSGRANRRRLALAGDLLDLSGEPLMSSEPRQSHEDVAVTSRPEAAAVTSRHGAGKNRRSLGDERIDALPPVLGGGAGADRQGLAAKRTLGPGHGDLTEQSLRGDLGRTRSGEQLGDDAVGRGLEVAIRMHLGDQPCGPRLLRRQHRVEQGQMQRPVQAERGSNELPPSEERPTLV